MFPFCISTHQKIKASSAPQVITEEILNLHPWWYRQNSPSQSYVPLCTSQYSPETYSSKDIPYYKESVVSRACVNPSVAKIWSIPNKQSYFGNKMNFDVCKNFQLLVLYIFRLVQWNWRIQDSRKLMAVISVLSVTSFLSIQCSLTSIHCIMYQIQLRPRKVVYLAIEHVYEHS